MGEEEAEEAPPPNPALSIKVAVMSPEHPHPRSPPASGSPSAALLPLHPEDSGPHLAPGPQAPPPPGFLPLPLGSVLLERMTGALLEVWRYSSERRPSGQKSELKKQVGNQGEPKYQAQQIQQGNTLMPGLQTGLADGGRVILALMMQKST